MQGTVTAGNCCSPQHFLSGCAHRMHGAAHSHRPAIILPAHSPLILREPVTSLVAAPVGGRHAIDEKFQQLVLEEISTLKGDIDLERSERLQEDDQIVASPCSACLCVTMQAPMKLMVKHWSVCRCMALLPGLQVQVQGVAILFASGLSLT